MFQTSLNFAVGNTKKNADENEGPEDEHKVQSAPFIVSSKVVVDFYFLMKTFTKCVLERLGIICFHECTETHSLKITLMTDDKDTVYDIYLIGLFKKLNLVCYTQQGTKAIGNLFVFGDRKNVQLTTYDTNLQTPGFELTKTLSVTASQHGALIHLYVYHQIACVSEKATIFTSRVEKVRSFLGTNDDVSLSNYSVEYECNCKCGKDRYPWGEEEIRIGNGILMYLQNVLHLTPMGSEVLIIWAEAKLFTKVDLICIDNECRVTVVSLKTGRFGMDNYDLDTGDYMKGAWKDIPDTLANRHNIQVSVEAYILNNIYNIEIFNTIIIYSHNFDTRVNNSSVSGITHRNVNFKEYSKLVNDTFYDSQWNIINF